MLVELTATNFRSYRDAQTLSMVRSKLKDSDKLESHSFPFPDKPDKGLLRSAALYGANASGKSNLLSALETMQKVVIESASWQRGDKLPVEPYLLAAETTKKPSEFEIIFYADDVRFQYGFSATKERVFDEWLYAYPSGRAQTWIERTWDDNVQKYIWGRMDALKGQKKLWKDSSRENALFLSVAVQLNCEQLRPVFDWFELNLHVIGMGEIASGYTASRCSEDNYKERIVHFLKSADLNISDITVESKKLQLEDFPDDLPEELKQSIANKKLLDVRFTHEGENGFKAQLPMHLESDGTKKLFAFSGPWLEVLEKGSVLFIDELHDNLHPLIVKMLVRLFHSKKTNPNNAQLVFTTHETSILSQDIFRRDQIWFASQEGSQGTYLTPLSNFNVRKGAEDIERYYLDGRYGAVPYLPHSYADIAISMEK